MHTQLDPAKCQYHALVKLIAALWQLQNHHGVNILLTTTLLSCVKVLHSIFLQQKRPLLRTTTCNSAIHIVMTKHNHALPKMHNIFDVAMLLPIQLHHSHVWTRAVLIDSLSMESSNTCPLFLSLHHTLGLLLQVDWDPSTSAGCAQQPAKC